MSRKNTAILAVLAFSSLAPLWIAAQQKPASAEPQTKQSAPQAGPLEYRETDVAARNWPKEAVRAPEAMIVSDNALADKAGLEILKKGGNAVDAAAAVAFALAVVEPRAGNIGGGGFMLLRLASGKTVFVDYREEAPASATRELYKKADGTYDTEGSRLGYRASGVPGTVAGMALAVKTYGRLKLADVMAPAIRLAQGFTISDKLATSLKDSAKRLQQFDRSNQIFLNGGKLYQTGDSLKQPALAETLKRIAQNGPAEFYQGKTAQELTADMAQNGGLLTMADLAAYKAKIRTPLHASYDANGAKWDVYTSPPPSSGGIAMIEALNILSPEQLKGWNDATSVHWVAEAMRLVFADRATFLGDSDFVHVPLAGLTDPRYAAERRATIDPTHASSSQSVGAGNPAPFDKPKAAAGAASLERVPRRFLARASRGAFALRSAARRPHHTLFRR